MRDGGDWDPLLEQLRVDPVRMVLGAVVLQAWRDAAEEPPGRRSQAAAEFLRRVRRNYEDSGDASYAVLMAMRSGAGSGGR